MNRMFLMPLLAMTVTANLQAQTVYRSIGPDGRAVYSDKPPADAVTESKVISLPAAPPIVKPAAAPAAQAADPAAKLTQPDSPRAGAKQAVAPTHAARMPATAPAKPAVEPAVEKAVIGVLGMEDLIKQTEDLCVQTLPTSFARYGEATRSWRQRNADVIARARRVLTDAFDPLQREQIKKGLTLRNEQSLTPIVGAPMAARIRWCDESAERISGGSMDVRGSQTLAAPLKQAAP